MKMTDYIIFAATFISLIATIFIYPNLPAMMPYQWGIDSSVKTAGK